jgi:hypothetical protein
MRDLKAECTNKELDMFLNSHVAAKNGVLRRADLLEIFDEPFRLAKYQRLENQSAINR